MINDLEARVRSLEAERQRPDVGERVAGYLTPIDATEALRTLLGLLAQLFRKDAP